MPTLVNHQGQLLDYDTDEDASADIANLGYRWASEQEISRYDQAKAERQQYGTASQQALAAGELALGSATFGLLSPDSEAAQARRRQFRQQSPFLAAGAEIAGALVPGAGAAGLAAKGAKALGLAGRAAELGISAAGDFTAGLSQEAELAEEEHRSIDVGSVAMWTVGGLMAEHVIRSGVAALRRTPIDNNVIPAAKTKAVEFRETALSDKTPDVRTAKPYSRDLTTQEVKKVASNYAEIKDNARQLGQEAGNSFLDSFDEAHNVSFKAEDIRGKMAGSAEKQTLAQEEHLERLNALADKLEGSGGKKQAEVLRSHAFRIETAADSADLFIALDQSKRTVDKYRKKVASAARKSGLDPFGEKAAMFDEFSNPVRADLEKSELWGDFAASKQKAENARWSGKDGYINNWAIVQDQFYEQLPGSAAYDFDGLPQFAWSDEGFASFAEKDRIGQKHVLNAFRKVLDSAEDMTKIKEGFGLRAEDMVKLKDDLKDLREVYQTIQDLTEARSRGKDFIDAASKKSESIGSKVAQAIGGSLGVASGGGPTAAIAGAKVASGLDELFNPPKAGAALDALKDRGQAREALKARFETVGKAPASFSQRMRESAGNMGQTAAMLADQLRRPAELYLADPIRDQNSDDLQELSEHARAHTNRAAKAFASNGSAKPLPDPASRFQGGHANLSDAWQSKSQFLIDAAADPTVVAEHLARSFGTMPDTHPALFTAIAGRTQAGVSYLLENMPPSVAFSMRDPQGLPPSDAAIREFSRLWSAVFEPAETIRDIAAMRATPAQIEALKEVHPDVFEDFQGKTLAALAGRQTPPSWETQRYFDQIMGLQGAYSPVLAPDVVKAIQGALQIGTQQSPGSSAPSGRPSRAAQTMAPATGRLTNGPTFGSRQ